jgi:hypothetical protein
MTKNCPRYGGPRRNASGQPDSTPSRPDPQLITAAILPAKFYPYEIATMPKPKGGGWVDGGLCPIHGDRTPDVFLVNTRTGAFRCSACGAEGKDIIEFTMLRYELGREQAVSALAREYGVRHG